jgi:hypothetical protein
MKSIVFILTLFSLSLKAQVSVTPFVGLNSTKMSEAYSGFAKGGNVGFFGVEVEKQFRVKNYSPLSFSLVSGLSYLSNGFEQTYSSTISIGSGIYNYRSTDLRMRYLQVPLMARINWTPFPLVENWQLFLGAGISVNQLMYAHLAERASEVPFSPFVSNPALYPPPLLSSYSDSREVTSLGVRTPLFDRFELGMKFKHLQVTFRISASLQDMYLKGLENTWKVPALDSYYINAHNSRGITKEKYSEIIFGWRFP